MKSSAMMFRHLRGQIQTFNFLYIKTHLPCSVLSQDSNIVFCFGVRCSEPPKNCDINL